MNCESISMLCTLRVDFKPGSHAGASVASQLLEWGGGGGGLE